VAKEEVTIPPGSRVGGGILPRSRTAIIDGRTDDLAGFLAKKAVGKEEQGARGGLGDRDALA